jgi:DNA-binding NtrC family response regulator
MRRLLARDFIPRPASLRVRQVLVVDPDPAVLAAAASALHQHGGFKVFLARDAAEAATAFDSEHPEIVLVDSAFVAAEAPLRAHILAHNRPECGVIRLVTRGAPQAAEGDPLVRGTLEKPLSPLELGRQIEELLDLPPSNEQSPDARDHLNREVLRVTRGGS